MALPKIEKPIFTLKAPSDGREIKYRPYTVKEEKILLIAQESRDVEQMFLAANQVLTNCIVSDEIVEDMPMIDVEYLNIAVRSKSVGSIVEFSVSDGDTRENVSVQLDLDNVSVVRKDNHSNEVRINKDYVLVMRYPSFRDSSMLLKASDTVQRTLANYEIMKKCMCKIVSSDGSIYDISKESDEEIENWLDDLDAEARQRIQEFFDTSPVIKYEFQYVNSKGEQKKLIIQGLESFFV